LTLIAAFRRQRYWRRFFLAVLFYPVPGISAGHGLMRGRMLARGRWVPWLSGVPFLWSLIGLAVAVQLGIPEDLGMPVAGLTLAILLLADRVRGRASDLRAVPPVQQ